MLFYRCTVGFFLTFGLIMILVAMLAMGALHNSVAVHACMLVCTQGGTAWIKGIGSGVATETCQPIMKYGLTVLAVACLVAFSETDRTIGIAVDNMWAVGTGVAMRILRWGRAGLRPGNWANRMRDAISITLVLGLIIIT